MCAWPAGPVSACQMPPAALAKPPSGPKGQGVGVRPMEAWLLILRTTTPARGAVGSLALARTARGVVQMT